MTKASRLLRLLGWTSLGALIVCGLLAALLIHQLPADGIRLSIDGETWNFPALGAGHWLGVTLVLLAVVALLVIALPVALLLSVGVPLVVLLLVLAGTVLATVVALAVGLSPLVALGFLAWGAWRLLVRRPAPPAATIEA